MASQLRKTAERIGGYGRGQGAAVTYDPTHPESDLLMSLPMELIDPDPDQPRKYLGDLRSLEESIELHGLIQPIVVSRIGDRFRILAGHRRYTAFKNLSRAEIPAIIRSNEEHHRRKVQLLENIERKDLNPFELAATYLQLMRDFHFDQDALAKYLKISPVTVSETLTLNQLPERIREEGLRTSEVSRSLLIELARVPDVGRQLELWERAKPKDGKKGDLTVRDLREERPRKRSPKAARPVKPAGSCRVLKLNDTTVTIQFAQEDATDADVVRVLHEALESLESSEPAQPHPW